MYPQVVVDVINIRMPKDEVAALDAIAATHYRSRTEAIRDAVARLVREIREQELVEAHRRAYAPEATDQGDAPVLRQSRKSRARMVAEEA